MAEIRLVALDTKGKPDEVARIKESCEMAFQNYTCGRCHISTNTTDFKLYAEIVFFANLIADDESINPEEDSAAFLKNLLDSIKRLIPSSQLKSYQEKFNIINSQSEKDLNKKQKT